MGDTALADFMGRYISWALEIYQRTARRMRLLGPFGQIPFPMPSPFASYEQHEERGAWGPEEPDPAGYPEDDEPVDREPPPPPPARKPRRAKGKAPEAPAATAPHRDDVASLRHELEELKRILLDKTK
jgi:hypothetical protein